jgi:hypothetical protein
MGVFSRTGDEREKSGRRTGGKREKISAGISLFPGFGPPIYGGALDLSGTTDEKE